jgi:putative spermidine/putrescine transport system substrate-binding protein
MRIAPYRRAAMAAAVLLLASACSSAVTGQNTSGGGGGGFVPPGVPAQPNLTQAALLAGGEAEGEVDLVAWAGYAQDGSDGGPDWVHPFEAATGCQVNVTVADTSDEMVELMKTGEYDAVSASGDVTLQLIAGGDVAPANTSLVPNYTSVYSDLKLQPWNSVGGVPYGIPQGRGANLLMYNTEAVTPAPTSWSAVFNPDSPYAGKITDYDGAIYLADGALYLMKTKPALGIKNPYELTRVQFNAVVALLKAQHGEVGDYWSDDTTEQAGFDLGDDLLGTTWQATTQAVQSGKKVSVDAIVPSEGSTGWSDTWMISATSAHPDCAYEWMNWVVSPKVNAEVATYSGQAPSNPLACTYADASEPGFCTAYHADDAAYWKNIYYWSTPTTDCGDGSDDCVPYTDWVTAWNEIEG